MVEYLKAEKESIQIEVTTLGQILVGKFHKDKGIRLIDYLNRVENKQKFIVLSDVNILDYRTRQIIETKEFLAINVEYIVTATENRN
jgi:hypothetical protein